MKSPSSVWDVGTPTEAWAVCTRVSLLSGLCKINITTSAGGMLAPWQVEQCGMKPGGISIEWVPAMIVNGYRYLINGNQWVYHIHELCMIFPLIIMSSKIQTRSKPKPFGSVVDLFWTTLDDQMTGSVSTKKKDNRQALIQVM